MVADKFFRGENRMDYLFGIMLQTACDFGDESNIKEVGRILGDCDVQQFAASGNVYPQVTLVVFAEYVFVVSASTRGPVQWVGNVLGSRAVATPPSHGTVSQYFGLVATFQWDAVRARVVSLSATRRVVFVGFSLGGASLTIVKDMAMRASSLPSAAFVFGAPRPGTSTFIDGYPTDNYAGVGLVNDPIPSVPPTIWTGSGSHNAWTPFPPFVTYGHVAPGATLALSGELTPGYSLQPVQEVVLGFDIGTFVSFHNQPLYARSIRIRDMPATLTDGYEGYPNAGLVDETATRLFAWASPPWPFAPEPLAPTRKVAPMGVNLTMHFRDSGGVPTGFREVYYFDGDDIEAPLTQALTSVNGQKNLSMLRRDFLSSSVEIFAATSSHVGLPKKAKTIKFKQPQKGTQGPMGVIKDCITYFGYTGSRQSKRQFHFRGITKTWLDTDKLTALGANSIGKIETFMAALKSAGFRIKYNDATIANGIRVVAAAKATQESKITFTLASVSTFVPGNLVELTGVKEAPILNGTYQVVAVPTTSQLTLSGTQRYSCPAVITGVIKAVTPLFANMADWEFWSVGARDTGKPSFLPRGRQSAKLLRR